MAKKVMTAIKADFNKITKVDFETATAANDGFELKLKGSDEYVVILVQNTHASSAYDITVKAPENGSYAASDEDLTRKLEAGEIAVIRVESAVYANTDGTITLIPENVAVKASVIY